METRDLMQESTMKDVERAFGVSSLTLFVVLLSIGNQRCYEK
jgi:hypothetical protein